MLTWGLAVLGFASIAVSWHLAATQRVSPWVSLTGASTLIGVVALVVGPVGLSPEVGVAAAAGAGAASGVALYAGTSAFVHLAGRWRRFDLHVERLYSTRGSISVPLALVLGAGLAGVGEELFWRGVVQPRLSVDMGWVRAAVLTWAIWTIAYLFSRSIPILLGAVVAGAVWGALAVWTHGVLASAVCHVVWTGLMVGLPPGPTARRAFRDARAKAVSLR